MNVSKQALPDMSARVARILGRCLIALLFVPAGIAKLTSPPPFLTHMAQHGVPGWLLPFVAVLEIGCGAAILSGILWRPASAVLGLFCVATAFLFHFDLSDHVERTMFLKDLAIAGGLLVVAGSTPPGKKTAGGQVEGTKVEGTNDGP